MRHRFYFVLLVILLISSVTTTHAQEEFIEPPSKHITKIPFIQFTGGVVVIRALLNDIPDTLNFVLDTGSSGISLDSTTADYLGLKPVETERTIRGIAGIRKVPFLYHQKLRFPGLVVDSLDFHVNDYSILTAVYGEQIDGIIGYSFLSRYILKINYDSLKIDICSNGTIKYPRGGYLFKPIINNLPVHSIRLKDAETITSRFLWDMGAGVCMMLTTDFVGDSAFLDKKRKRYVKEGEGVGGKIDMELTVMQEIKLGPYRFRKVPTYVFNDTFNVTNYPHLGGLIGNDILRRFNCILNYAKRDFYLTPNSHYNDPFDYSYSGLELYYVNGYIIVGDVAKGSPAEAVGLKEDDIIIAINANFNQNLNEYKQILQNANERIKLIVRRGSELMDFSFKIKSIL